MAKSLSQNIYTDSSAQFISDNHIKIHGESGEVSLNTINPGVVRTEIAVGILPCSPSGHGAETACKFSGDYGGLVKHHPWRHLQCRNKLDRKLYTTRNKQNTEWQECAFTVYEYRIENIQIYQLMNQNCRTMHLCGKITYDGPLCDKCQEEYHLAKNAVTLTCVICSEDVVKSHWVFLLL